MRASRVVAPLVVVIAVLVQFRPVLAGRVYRFEDIAGYFEPLWTAAARALGEGRWPLWDPGAWSGQPLVGDPQLGAFYPPHWLYLVMPVLRVYALMALVHAAWGGLGMYLLARARGGSRAAAAVAGLALGVGGYVVLQVRHIMFVEATAWVPWVVLTGWRMLDGSGARPGGFPPHIRSRGAWGWAAGMALATGMMFLTGGVSMIYYGMWFIVAVLGARALAGTGRMRRVALLALAGVVGLVLAAPVLAPMVAHGPLSPRARGTEYAFAASVAWGGWHFLPSLFLPNLLGQEVRGSYFGGGTQWEIAGYYAGMLPFALAVVAWLRGARERRGERIALAALCLLALLLAPGARSPVHRLAFHVIPLYDAMRCPPRALYLFALAVPLLAAEGLDIALRRFGPRRGALAMAAVALVAADLLLTHRAENPGITPAEARAAAFPAAVRFLAEHRGERYVNDVHASHHLHNSGLLWGLENASGYSSLPPWRYLHYLWILNHGAVYPYPRLHDDISAQGIWRYESRLVDALAVRWVLSERAPGPAHYVLRFQPSDGSKLAVYENLRALQRAWVVRRVEAVASADEAARAVARPGFDPAEVAVVEWGRSDAPPAFASDAAGQDTVRREAISPVEVVYDVEIGGRGGLLVLAEPAYPGWRAVVDGQEVEVLTVDYALRGVVVPEGKHRVVMRYAR